MDFLRSSWLLEAKTSFTNTPGRFFFLICTSPLQCPFVACVRSVAFAFFFWHVGLALKHSHEDIHPNEFQDSVQWTSVQVQTSLPMCSAISFPLGDGWGMVSCFPTLPKKLRKSNERYKRLFRWPLANQSISSTIFYDLLKRTGSRIWFPRCPSISLR